MCEILKKFGKDIPHLLFYGNNEDESILVHLKTFYKGKENYIFTINCAISKGIKNIREDVKLFSKQQLSKDKLFKIIILYEAQYLTVDAQYSLRRTIEMYSTSTRFIIFTKNKNKLLQPVRSRFIDIYIPDKPIEEKIYINYNVIKKIITTNDSIINITNKLYQYPLYSNEVIIWLKDKINNYYELSYKIQDYSKEFKHEKFILFYLVCFFRNNKKI